MLLVVLGAVGLIALAAVWISNGISRPVLDAVDVLEAATAGPQPVPDDQQRPGDRKHQRFEKVDPLTP